MPQTDDTGTMVFVATDPPSLSDAQKRDARRLASRMEIKWTGVKKLDGVIGSGDPADVLILVGDDWQDMVKHCRKSIAEPLPLISPLWMGTSPIDSVVDYFELTECEDLDKRLRYMCENKKLACIFGNCQTRPLRELIARHEQFAEDYHIIKMPFVQDVNKKIRDEGFNETFLKKLDLLITMNISKENKYSEKVSTEYMLSKLPKKCRVVRIPNCYFTAYFPQAYSRTITETQPFIKPAVTDRLTEKDCYAEEVLQHGGELPRPTIQEVNANLERTVSELIEREKICDVKMSDFILENYKKQRLFYSRSHPTGFVLKEHARRVLTYLGYTCTDLDTEGVYEIDHRKEFIYDEAYDYLGLGFRDDSYVNKFVSDEPFDEELYIAMLKMFKQPEHWTRSVKWINKPLDKSIDFSANIDASSLARISFKSLDVSSSMAHLSLDLTILEDVTTWKIISSIPECMSPSHTHFAIGHYMDGSISKIKVESNGIISISGPVKKDMELLIDTTWLL